MILHCTMVFKATKSLVAKRFGHWLNETYSLDSPRTMGVANAAGMTKEIVARFSLTA